MTSLTFTFHSLGIKNSEITSFLVKAYLGQPIGQDYQIWGRSFRNISRQWPLIQRWKRHSLRVFKWDSKGTEISKSNYAEQDFMMWLRGLKETLLLVGRNATDVEHAKDQRMCTALDVQPLGKFLKLQIWSLAKTAMWSTLLNVRDAITSLNMQGKQKDVWWWEGASTGD